MAKVTLLDALTRHQIYIEGVKSNQAAEFNEVLLELQTDLRLQFARLRYATLDQLTRRELRNFVNTIKQSQSKIYNGYTTLLLRMIREFMEADIELSTAIFEETTGKTRKQAEEEDETGEPFFLGGLAASSGTEDGNNKLWAFLLNSPLPANGVLLAAFVAGFSASAVKAVENAIQRGYANRAKLQDTLTEILGTKSANYRDGVFNGINNQASAVIATVLQHASAIAQNSIGSVFLRKYRWVSVIDNRTSEICASRNNKVYVYGKGPLPPAHIRCRSKVVPIASDQDAQSPSSYHSWLKAQPAAVLNDILGRTRGQQVYSGKSKATEYPSFSDVKPLTISQFKAKRQLILTQS
jgi:SPP1 gp7 family putative phage head morphogenesis protein